MKKIIKTEEDKLFVVLELDKLDISEEKPYIAEIKRYREKRSLDQNALLWLWMTALEKDSETGYTKDDFYQYFLEKFAPRKEVMGKYVIISTSKMDTKQMTEFLDNIQRFSLVELKFELPNPDDLKFEQFKNYYSEFI